MFEKIGAFHNSMLPMNESDWECFTSVLLHKHFVKGELLLREAETCKSIYFLNKGAVRHYKLVDGKEFICHFAFENNYTTSYESFIKQIPSDEYLETLEDTECLVITAEAFAFLATQSAYLASFTKLMAEKSLFESIKNMLLWLPVFPNNATSKLLKNTLISYSVSRNI